MWLWLFPLSVPAQERSALAAGRASCIPLSLLACAVHFAHVNRLPEALTLLEDQINQAPPMEADGLRLLRAVLQLQGKEAQGVLEELISLLPFFEGRQFLQALCWMLMAQAEADRGSLSLAAELLSRAEGKLLKGQSRPLKIYAQALKVELLASLGDHQRAEQLAAHALKGARGELERYIAHRTLAVWHRDPLDRSTHAMAARLTAPGSRERQEAERLYHRSFGQLGGDRPLLTPSPARQVHLQLLGGARIHIDGRSLNCASTPQLVLLLTYVLLYPGRTLAQVAEDLLPLEDAGPVRYSDEAHRVARIRRDVSRARALLSDPAAIVCTQGTLHLDASQIWSSDLQVALLGGEAGQVTGSLPVTLDCEWLDQLRSGLPATHG